MKAIEILHKIGLDQAKEIVLNATNENELLQLADLGIVTPEPCEITILEIKDVIESTEIVNALGGLEAARKEAHKNCFVFNTRLLKAVYDLSNY